MCPVDSQSVQRVRSQCRRELDEVVLLQWEWFAESGPWPIKQQAAQPLDMLEQRRPRRTAVRSAMEKQDRGTPIS
jgi:hypothetical protein